MQFTGKGSKKFQKITSGLYRRGNLLGAPQHFAIVLDREIKSFPQIDPNDSSLVERHQRQRADHGPQLVQRGEEPRARPPDRFAAVPVHDAREHERLRDARQGLAAAGEARGDRRPDRRRDLPAPPLPLHGRHRGARPRHLRRAPLRRDPAPERDADAAGLRGTDPHDRRCRGRERRRVRTHQGRGAVREVRARRDRRRLREGLPHDSRRERRHGDHRAWCSSRSRPRASRASR